MEKNDIMLLLSRIAALVGIFSLSLFPELVKISLPIATALSLFSGNWSAKYQILKKNKLIITSVVLVGLFIIGTLYSVAPLSQITSGFFKYNKILYLVFLLPLFTERKWRIIAENVLIAAIFLDIIVCAFAFHGAVISERFYPGGYMHYAINTSAILGFILFILINRIIDNKAQRYLNLTLFCVGFFSLFFMYVERTGQLVFLGLIALGLWQRFRIRGALISLITIPLIFGALFLFSPKFHDRIVLGVEDISAYVKTDGKDNNTSLGLRLAFTEYSLKAIKAHPFFGNGTGSFKFAYVETQGPGVGSKPLQDPHNEYVIILVQLGILGLIYFLFWLITAWVCTKKLPLPEKNLAQGLILSFVVIGFCNTALFIGLSGLFYIIFLSVYFASEYDNNKVFI